MAQDKDTNFFSPQQQKFLGGISRGISSAFSPQQKQTFSDIGTALTTPVIGGQTQPIVKPPAPMVKQLTPVVPQNTGMIDLGGGSSITTRQPLPAGMVRNIQTAAKPSTPEQIANREANVANYEKNLADERAFNASRAAPQNMGMQRPMPVAQGPDYSGAIDRAIGALESDRPSGSFDRQVEWKNKVGAAKDLLGLVGNMQTAGNQQATQRDIAAMGDLTDQQRTQALRDEAQQRTALGMGQLASEDQYKQGQVANDARKMAMEKAIKEDEMQRATLARAELAKALEMENTGIFGGIDPIAQAKANALRLGGLNYSDVYPKPKQ